MWLALLASAAAWPEAHAACDGLHVGEPPCPAALSTVTATPALPSPYDAVLPSETFVEAVERVHLPLSLNSGMTAVIKAVQGVDWLIHHAMCTRDLHTAHATVDASRLSESFAR